MTSILACLGNLGTFLWEQRALVGDMLLACFFVACIYSGLVPRYVRTDRTVRIGDDVHTHERRDHVTQFQASLRSDPDKAERIFRAMQRQPFDRSNFRESHRATVMQMTSRRVSS